ncbi:MAG TPA: MlaD family protein [Terriglobales bacterium]|nr:MlaD family protein [Terriglobales bacterium]
MSRAFRLGIFIVAALALLGTGIFLIGNRQFLFTPTYGLKAQFDNASGLAGGADVRVGGIRMGTVQQIQLPSRPDEKVTVVMDVVKSTRDIIKKDSVAFIKTEGLLGSKYVEISFGSDEAPRVGNGDTIAGEPPLDISDLIKKTNDILDATKDTTSNLKAISGDINDGKGTLGALVHDRQVYKQLSATAAQAEAGAASFHENMQALKQNWFFRGFFNKRGYKDAAELTRNSIAELPPEAAVKKFTYDAGRLFGEEDSAKLKKAKNLNEAGRYLEGNRFGLAVVVAYSGMKGDAQKDLLLSEARAMAVRQYLAENFRMDDTRVKTLGLGKSGEREAGLEILVYPQGAKVPRASGVRAKVEAGNAGTSHRVPTPSVP